MPTPRLRTARRAPNTELCELFAPIAAFLLRAGITKAELMAELRTAIDRVSRAKSGVPVVRIGVENLASSLVSRWMRDPKYLNHVGRPDDLPLNGTRSVASLLKADQVKISPTRALSLLLDLGTVKKVAKS